jgi:hypothetical protein
VGLPRYLATAYDDDLERTLALADELLGTFDRDRVALVQCGGPSARAAELAALLVKAGRRPVSLVVSDREQAQSDAILQKLWGISSAWVFVEDLFGAYMSVFATQLTFAMRHLARDGLPVMGVGSGALALGGLLVARRVCNGTHYDLVNGLGWAPRVLVDGGGERDALGAVARTSVCSLHGLLGVDVGLRGGVRVRGGRVESIGSEPISLFSSDGTGHLVSMSLEAGQATTIAPPPFPPFTTELLPNRVTEALSREALPSTSVSQAPLPVLEYAGAPAPTTPEGPRLCPMCNKIHDHEPTVDLPVELAA